MPPRSADHIMVNSMANSLNAMTNNCDGAIVATSDVAVASLKKQPVTAPAPETDVKEDPTIGEGDETFDSRGDCHNVLVRVCVDPSLATEEEAACCDKNKAGDVGESAGEVLDNTSQGQKNGSLKEQSKVEDASEHQPSSEERASFTLDSSAKSTDSWGGNKGSLPSLPGGQGGGVLAFENDIANIIDGTHGSAHPPQDPPPIAIEKDVDDIDVNEPTNFINVNKLLEPSSSEYYYSSANRKQRQMLNKAMSKKNIARGSSLDESGSSKQSVLTELSRASSYRGPMQLKKDGSSVKSIVKSGRKLSSGSINDCSVDSPVQRSMSEPKAKTMRRCTFSSVDIREHERVAGDNPCVSSGVPLSIGWGYYQHASVSLDDYEAYKGPPRDKIEMMVPASIRRKMLRDEFSVSISDINASMKNVNISKRQRKQSLAMEHMEGWTEAAQSAKRKLKRFVKKTTTAKEQEKLWASAHEKAVAEYMKNQTEGSSGKYKDGIVVGKFNQGHKVSPTTGDDVPLSEISFHSEEVGAP